MCDFVGSVNLAIKQHDDFQCATFAANYFKIFFFETDRVICKKFGANETVPLDTNYFILVNKHICITKHDTNFIRRAMSKYEQTFRKSFVTKFGYLKSSWRQECKWDTRNRIKYYRLNV